MAIMALPADWKPDEELALRSALQGLPGAAAAALYAAAAGVIVGILGCVLAGSLAFGARSAVIGFLVTCAVLGYARWRAHRSQRRGFLDRWYHEDLSVPARDESFTHIRFTDKSRTNAKGRR
jgi:high-affinity Fe2+/Pb2+ permease